MRSSLAPPWHLFALVPDFRGRARSLDIVGALVLLMILNMPVIFGESLGLLSFEDGSRVQLFILIAMLCPMIALFVRRLHDQGRSGWWLVAGVPALFDILAGIWHQLTFGIEVVAPPQPLAMRIVSDVSKLVVLVMMFLPEQQGPNPYGPDPRESDPQAASPVKSE